MDMDLSAMQPSTSAAEVGILATFLPTNAGSAAVQPGSFESLLEDALGFAVPTTQAVEASGENLAAGDVNAAAGTGAGSDGNTGTPIVGMTKDGGHKKADSKRAGGDNAGTAALYALTMAPVPIERLQRLDPPATALMSSSQAAQSQQVSGAQILTAPGNGVQPTDRAQSGASAALEKIVTGGFELRTNAEVSPPKSGSQPEGQNTDSPTQKPLTSQPAPKIAEYAEKSDRPNFESTVSHVFLSRDAQRNEESSSPVEQLSPPKTSESVQPKKEEHAVANAPDDSALTATVLATATDTLSQMNSGAAPAATLFLPVQAGNDSAAAATSLANAMANLVFSAPQDPSSIVPSTTHVPVSTQPGKDAPRVEVPIVPLLQPQLTAQLQPQPQVQPQLPQTKPQAQSPLPQTQPQAGPKGMHNQHAVKGDKPLTSGLTQGESPADAPKSTAATILIRPSATHHSVINSQPAASGPLTKADATTSAADSSPTNSTPVRDADRKSSQTSSQVSPAPPSAQATTSTPAPVQPVTSPALNSPVPPAAVPTAASQPVPVPSQTPPQRLAVHDLPPATHDPAAPVEIRAARIVQTDSRAGMRLDMQTQAFGGIEVHTSVTGKDVQLSVSAEHGDLHSFLAPEMPMLQSQLQQHDLRLQQVRTMLNYGTQPEFSSGSGRQEQRFARPHSRSTAFDQHNITGSSDEEDSPKGLSIRI